MTIVFKNAMIHESGEMKMQNMLFDGATLSVFHGDLFPAEAKVIDNAVIFPGFCDVHVHFREPGF
jgi:dihydroorotase-like cyclic amidohydrolase